MMKWFNITATLFAAGTLAALELAELDAERDRLLNTETLAGISAADPRLGEWLTAQKKITANLAAAIQADPVRAESMKQDYRYLLTRLAEELRFARTAPVIDETKFHNVREFGAKGDGTGDDGEAIRRAIAATAAGTDGKRTVYLPRGSYPVKCTGNETGNIKLENLESILLLGERGTEIVLPGPLDVALRISGCNDVRVKNLSFTYRKAPYTTGTIVDFPADDTIRVKLDPGMAAPTDGMFKQAQTKGLMRFYTAERVPGSLRPFQSSIAPHQGAPTVTRVDDETYDFKVNSFTPVARNYAKNLRVAFYARTYGNHAINNVGSNRTRLENLKLNTSSAMGILNQSGERAFIIDCAIEALPGSFVSTSADGIYFRNISLGGLVRGNKVRHIGDDFINIHTIVAPAVRAAGKTLFVRKSDWNGNYFKPGSRLGLLETSAGRNAPSCEGTIESVEADADLLKVTLDTDFGNFATLETLAANPELKLPDFLMLLDNQCHGLVLKNNLFEDGLSRFLAGGRNWLFTGNTVVDTLNHSLFMNLCPEAKGKNGGEFVAPRNIELSGNRFVTTGKTLFRFGGSANASRVPDHSVPATSHITIADNDITVTGDVERPLFDIAGVEFLTVTGNRITAERPSESPFRVDPSAKNLKLDGNVLSGNFNLKK